MDLSPKPNFLCTWRDVKCNRFGTNNHCRVNQSSRYPDFFFRSKKSPAKKNEQENEQENEFEWVIEAKLWSVDGSKCYQNQTTEAVSGFRTDVVKWLDGECRPHAFMFMAVNVPRKFERTKKAKNNYDPNMFVKHLLGNIDQITELEKLNDHGDGLITIKEICEDRASLMCVRATKCLSESCPDDMKQKIKVVPNARKS
jgi:hypothetical protein